MNHKRENQSDTATVSTRRQFLRDAGVITAGVVAGSAIRAKAQGATPVGANDRIGVGMIGCGSRGTYLLKEVNSLKEKGANIEIVGVADVYRPRMEKAANGLKVKGYVDHHELLADPNVDVVGVATPDHVHGPLVIDVVQAKKHVYCEKPFTHWRQFDLTKRVVEEVKKSGCVFQLGTQGMSDSAWHQMRKLVQDGLIGQPIHGECGYFRVGDWGERGMPIDDPNAQPGPDLNWKAFLGDAPDRPFDVSRFFRWRMYEDYSGGPVTDLFPHSLTPLMYILGVTTPSEAVALGGKMRYDEREVPDTFNMLLNFPEKITVAVLGTQGNNYQGTGARGAGGRCPIVRGWDGAITVVDKEIVFSPAEKSNKDPQRFPIEQAESVPRHWENLFDCCRSGQQTESPIDLALNVQTALQMANLAMRNGKTARFNGSTQSIEI